MGGTGQLGRCLRGILPDAIAPTRSQFDLLETARIRTRLEEFAPDLVVNCAAFTAVDAAETDEATAVAINGTAVGELAAAASRSGIPFVTFSTDYVFDGVSRRLCTETTPPNPLNAYGRSKLAGELLALEYPGSLVIRTSWLLSQTHPNFVTAILARAREGEVTVVEDQWGRPTMAEDLAAATIRELESGTRGLLHLASPPTTSWFELARTACRVAGVDPRNVIPCSSERYSSAAQRPAHAVLSSDRGRTMPDWQVGLESWLAQGGSGA